MEIRNHSRSDKYFIVSNPTDQAIAKAEQLSSGNWAKVQENGLLIVHNNFRIEFETMIRIDNRNSTIAPEFETIDELETWLAESFNSFKAVAYYERLHPQVWNREYAGKTVEELEAFALS